MLSKAARKESSEEGISSHMSELDTSFQKPSMLDTSFEKLSASTNQTRDFQRSTSWREVLLKFGNRINQLEREVKRLEEKVSETDRSFKKLKPFKEPTMLKYQLYFTTPFTKALAVEQLVKGLREAIKKGIITSSEQELCKVHYLSQLEWESIRIEFLTTSSMTFKTHMRNQVFKLNNDALTTVKPSETTLYSSNEAIHLLTDSIPELIRQGPKILCQ